MSTRCSSMRDTSIVAKSALNRSGGSRCSGAHSYGWLVSPDTQTRDVMASAYSMPRDSVLRALAAHQSITSQTSAKYMDLFSLANS